MCLEYAKYMSALNFSDVILPDQPDDEQLEQCSVFYNKLVLLYNKTPNVEKEN